MMSSCRFVVQSAGCDYGIYDLIGRKFIGKPFDTYQNATISCDWFNDLYKHGMLKI